MFLTGNNSYRNALLPALLAAVLLLMGCSEGRDMRRLLRNVPAEAETVVCVNIEALAKEFRLTVDANRLTLPQRYASIEPQADAALLQLLKSGAIRLSAVVMFRVESHTFITGFVADKDAFMQMVESRTGRQFSNQGDRQVCGPVTIIGDRFWVSDADASKVYELSRLKGDDALPRKAADMLADDADDGFAMLTKCDALTAMAGNSPVATQIARQILGEAGYLCLKGDVDDDELELDGEFLNQQFQPVRNPGTLAVIDRNALLTLLPDAEKVTAIGLQKATLQQIAAAMPSALTQNAADARLSGVRLYTNQRFAANIALYTSLGYRIDREEALNGGVAVHMSKRVDHPGAIAAAIACVEAFTERFNAGDAAGMDALLHFPHVILDGARLIVWKTPGQLPQGYFDGLAAAGWRRSTYHDKRVVLSSPNKVHLLVDYSRDGEGGAVLSRQANLWIVTFEDGRWGVKQRSY